jgi:phosphatidylserine decarboxylase
MNPFFYQNQLGTKIQSILIQPWVSKVAGWYADRAISTLHIESFIKNYNIDMTQAEVGDPRRYFSFNDFFTRKLKPHARPIDQQQSSIISPCDGLLYIVPILNPDTEFLVKGKAFDLPTFLSNQKLTQEYYGGSMVVIYLAPQHYHRFHFPLDGVANPPMLINGNLESLNPEIYQLGIQPLTQNERQLVIFKTPQAGKMVIVMVGALCVGRIVTTHSPYQEYKKGDEMGYFSFGGSTIVLLFKKNTIQFNTNILTAQADKAIEVKMGQCIGYTSL